jgi:hypothetical protein
MGKNKESQLRESTWHSLSLERPLLPAVHYLLLEIGSMFLKSLSGIMNDHGLVGVKQPCHRNNIVCRRYWLATCVKERRLWEIK